MRHTARVRRRPALAPLLALLTACTGNDPAQPSTSNPTVDAGTSSGSGINITTGEPSTTLTTLTTDTSGPGMKLDLPPPVDMGSLEPGCGAVDILFVVDNSKSMAEYQMALAAAFPQFVDAMIDNLPTNVSLHVGLTTTDFTCANVGDPCCPDLCPVGNTLCQIGSTPEEIDALKSFYHPPTDSDNGVNGSQGRLFEYDGLAYFETNTSDDPAALKTWFTGAAIAAGEQGSSLEMPVAAAGFAANPVNAGNTGFIRNTDAILLIVFLTNDPDASLESVISYRDMVLAAKGNCPECVLTAGLLKSCVPAENQRLWQFMKAFGDDPIWSDIEKKTDYAKVVGQSLATTLTEACLNIPVG
jgi:hypothetical protein